MMDLWTEYYRFRDEFRKGMDEDLYPIGYLDSLVWSGMAQFRCTQHSAIVFMVKNYPSGAMDVHGLIAAGDAEEIKRILIPQAEEWGRRHRCIGAVVDSRPGWAKMLKSRGYEPFQVAVRKEL